MRTTVCVLHTHTHTRARARTHTHVCTRGARTVVAVQSLVQWPFQMDEETSNTSHCVKFLSSSPKQIFFFILSGIF